MKKEINQDLVKILQEGLKLEKRPFLRIAKETKMTEDEVICFIRDWVAKGIIRRVGLAVKPEGVGLKVNALVAWKVPHSKVAKVGEGMAECPEISHCYERECPPGWPYNLFTMIHTTDEPSLASIVSGLSEKFGIDEYKVFKTVRELKKTTMKYFQEED